MRRSEEAWTSSQRFMHVQFTSCLYGEKNHLLKFEKKTERNLFLRQCKANSPLIMRKYPVNFTGSAN